VLYFFFIITAKHYIFYIFQLFSHIYTEDFDSIHNSENVL